MTLIVLCGYNFINVFIISEIALVNIKIVNQTNFTHWTIKGAK